MNLKRHALTILTAIAIAGTPALAGDERLADTSKILSFYGFKNGVFNQNERRAVELSKKCDEKISAIEKDDLLLDTPEEFITAAYYSPIKITYKNQQAIDKELPKGKEGALKLAAMWKKKMADDTQNCKNCIKAIDIIKEKSGVTDSEIDKYYRVSIEKKIMHYAKEHLHKWYSEEALKKTICKPLINYYNNPTKKNEDEIVKIGIKLALDKQAKFISYRLVLSYMSAELGAKLASRINEEKYTML